MLWAGIRRSYRTRVVGVVVDPERCSGLIYGVPLGHGGSGEIRRGVRRVSRTGGRVFTMDDHGWLREREGSGGAKVGWREGIRCPVGTRGSRED